MQEQKDITDCYNKTAINYAARYRDELDKKHLDKILLKAFTAENLSKGKLIDLGCGPGQTTKFLSDCGFPHLLGVDISNQMVKVAKKINPHLDFETADILKLKYADNTFGSAIAFYSIINFSYDQIKIAFKEINRALVSGGQFLFSFHIGDDILHLDDFLGQQVNINFYFFQTSKISDLLTETGFEIIDIIERTPYDDGEYPSKRAYIWARTVNIYQGGSN